MLKPFSIKSLALLFLLVGAFGFVACDDDDDDPEPENEEEVITTMTMVWTPTGGGTPISLAFRDLDGDGGNAPVITGGTLTNGVTYTSTITLLNETETPAENITEEIEEEDDEHQFFFQVSGNLNFSFQYLDADDDGNPIGLLAEFTPQATGQGNLTVTLRHEPDKNASGVSDGDITNAGGETDIEVAFPVTVVQ